MPKTEKRTAEVRVLLPPSVKAALVRRAEEEGKSLSSLMLEAADTYLKSDLTGDKHPLARFAGLWADSDIEAEDIINSRTYGREIDLDF